MVCALALAANPREVLGEETNSPPPATSQLEQVSAQELLRVFVQLQEQLRATQLAIQENRQETKTAAAQNAEALSNGLQAMQEAFAAQRARDWAAMQSSNEAVLIVVGTFAAISVLTMLIMTYFQWRMSTGLAKISAALPAAFGLETGFGTATLGPAEPSSLHLPGATEQPASAAHEPKPGSPPGLKRPQARNLPIGGRAILNAETAFRRRRIRALQVVVVICLIFAAALALLLYLVTCRKLGFGPFHAVLKL
ncbi:MAG TPA: hypothetical protein P5205_19025 [Candidatus Paceibacterota bacterium]|nr:hypothetical protein [Candidatus Paceibacterota bacterium]